MNDRNVSLFVNHANRTFALSTRREQDSRLNEVIDIHQDAGYQHAFLSRNVSESQAKASVAVFRAAYESACGYTYQPLVKITKPLG